MLVYHLTSVDAALSIVESGVFMPVSQAPLNNDAGLNCFAFRPGYRLGQWFEGEGAKLVLKWSGPVASTHPDTAPPLPPNALHDQHPWRCFVPRQSDPDLLRVIRVEFDAEALNNAIPLAGWQRFLPARLRERLKRAKKKRLLVNVRRLCRAKPLYLQIA